MRVMEERWEGLQQQLADTKKQVMDSSELGQWRDELATLTSVLLAYDKWVSQVEGIADDAMDISRQLEQCRVCNLVGLYYSISLHLTC